jgi:hypothetical protein
LTGKEENGYVPDEVLFTKTEDEPRSKPDISRYEPAIVDGDFRVRPGNYVIIEHPRVCLGGGWHDTRAYIVQRIDGVTGRIDLYDPVRQQQAVSNFKTGPELGLDFRIPPKGRNPETLFTKKRRGRKKKAVDAPSEGSPPSEDAGAGKARKRRGRPKGSKNRPKHVIQAEKKAKAARAGRRRRKR